MPFALTFVDGRRASSCSSLETFTRQFKSKGGTFACPVALDIQGAAHFLGGQRAAVQAETVSAFLGGEAVREDAHEVLRRNANSVVNDDDPNALWAIGHAHGQFLVRSSGFVAGVLRIANQVHEDLQDLVLLHRDGGNRFILPNYL